MASVGDIVDVLDECLEALRASNLKLGDARTSAENLRAEALLMELDGSAARATAVASLIEAFGRRIEELVVAGEALLQRTEALRSGSAVAGPPTAPAAGSRIPRDRTVAPSAPALTVPSRKPNPAAVPEGEPEWVNPGARAIVQESIRLQNRSARVLARSGYRIRQLPQTQGRRSPDYVIENQIYDCIAPRSGTEPTGIRDAMRQKIKKGQADRFVVNLDLSALSADDLRGYLQRNPSSRVKEVLVVKGEVVTRVWP